MKITKMGEILDVPKGAFRATFEKDGWSVLGTEVDTPSKRKYRQSSSIKDVPFSQLSSSFKKETEDLEIEDEEIEEEIPISEMTVNELIEFAEEHNIDISNAKGKANIRQIILDNLER